MKFNKTSISGVFLIEGEPHVDERGSLQRHYCQEEFHQAGLNPVISQTNLSFNKKALTLRGFHYQLPPDGESRTLSCIGGSIYDIVVDLRADSATYMKSQSFELKSKDRLSLHVPPGCANAYLTQEDNTQVLYYHSGFYVPNSERGICYNDKVFDFKWPQEPRVISDRDKSHPDFKIEVTN